MESKLLRPRYAAARRCMFVMLLAMHKAVPLLDVLSMHMIAADSLSFLSGLDTHEASEVFLEP